MGKKPVAVIIGASFAGINAATALKRLEPGFEVIVIDKDDEFTMLPALYETAARGDYNTEITVPTSAIAKKHGFTFFHDEATFIDRKKRVVSTRNGESIRFDYLLVAVGSQTNYYATEGVDKHGLKLKHRQDAEKISERLELDLLKKKPLSIVVCGGGTSGVQFTAELADWLEGKGDHEITLCQMKPRLAPELPEEFGKLAQAALEKKGVKIHFNTEVARITKKGIETKAGEKHPADMVIWCGGNKPPELLAKTGLPLKDGYLAANEFLQSTGDERVFAAGDCASVKTSDGTPAYQTVWNAVSEGKLAGENISRHWRSQPLKPYSPSTVPIIFTIGRNYGVLHYKGFTLKGRTVAWLKRFIERFYINTL